MLEYWSSRWTNSQMSRSVSERVIVAVCTSEAKAQEMEAEHRKMFRTNVQYNISRVMADHWNEQ